MKNKSFLLGLVFVLLLVMTSGTVSATVTQDDLLNGLVSYYDGSYSSLTAIDVHGTNNGTASNSRILNADGKILKGFDFTKGDDSILLPSDVKSQLIHNQPSTVAFWYKPESLGTSFLVAIDGGSTTGTITSNQYRIWINSDNLTVEIGAVSGEGTGLTLVNDNMYHIVVSYDGTNNPKVYINGTYNFDGHKGTLTATNSDLYLGRRAHSASANLADGLMDEVAIYNRSLNSTEVEHLYDIQKDGNESGQYPFSTLDPIITTNLSSYSTINYNFSVNLEITNNDNAYNCTISTNDSDVTCNTQEIDYFTVNSTVINCEIQQNNNKAILFSPICENIDDTIYGDNKTITLDFLPPQIYTNINNSITTDHIYFWVDVEDVSPINLTIIDSCNYNHTKTFDSTTSLNHSFDYSTRSSNCDVGQYHTNITSCDNLGQCTTITEYWNIYAEVKITARNNLTDTLISNFSLYWVNDTKIGETTTGEFIFNISEQGNYNVVIKPTNFQYKNTTLTIKESLKEYEFNLFTKNSISIRIFDEATNNKILQEITIRFTSNLTEFTNTTSNSEFYIDDLVANEYQILFTTSGYNVRTYIITVGNNSHQFLNVYLPESDLVTTFTIVDKDSLSPVPSVFITMYRTIGGVWTAVESKFSDITGKTQFTYMSNVNYRFYLSKEGYEDYIFNLNPILFSDYDVLLTKKDTINYTQDFDKVSLIFSPHSFNNKNTTTFNFLISSPGGYLVEYGYTLFYPNANSSNVGYNAIGSQLSSNIYVNASYPSEIVRIEYYYIDSYLNKKEFTRTFEINYLPSEKKTFMWNREETYGLGLFERILIVTLILVFIMGISSLVGQPIPGFVITMFTAGYMVYIGFIAIWIILPSAFIGFFLISWRTGS